MRETMVWHTCTQCQHRSLQTTRFSLYEVVPLRSVQQRKDLMSPISSVSAPRVAQVQAQRAPQVDADGDNDGSKAAAFKPAAVQGQVAKLAGTPGSTINVYA
jgi:hypothetical protein